MLKIELLLFTPAYCSNCLVLHLISITCICMLWQKCYCIFVYYVSSYYLNQFMCTYILLSKQAFSTVKSGFLMCLCFF